MAVLTITLSSCFNAIESDESMAQSYKISLSNAMTTTSAPITEAVVTTTEKTEIIPSEFGYTKFKEDFSADDGELFGNVTMSDRRQGFSSENGYATGFSDPSADDWSVQVTLPASQYYNIALFVGSDSTVSNSLLVNSVVLDTFTLQASEKFQNVIFENVFMLEGDYTISFGLLDGNFDFDRLVIAASDEISSLSLELEKPTLSNKSPTPNALKLYDFICQSYGKNILSGQYVSSPENTEIKAIYEKTGKYPAIRFSDLLYYTADEGVMTDEITPAVRWHEQGGICGFSWHWAAPMNESSFYSTETEFNLANAVTSLDISTLDFKRIAELCDDKLISEECLEIVRDMDTVAQHLKPLCESDVPILFRPLHEASGGWFWWGCDRDSYLWLWELLYKRFTEYHGLNNLIWVWNAQNPDWYVGDKYCDIISADIYSATSTERHINAFLSLNEISDNKPVALSECDALPTPETLSRDKTMWSFFSFWSGDYMIDENGRLNQKYISDSTLIKLYNNTLVLTREDLEN